MTASAAARGAPPADGATAGEIVKSANDRKEYRRIMLPNQMNVLLISDPEVAELLNQDDEPESAGGAQGAAEEDGGEGEGSEDDGTGSEEGDESGEESGEEDDDDMVDEEEDAPKKKGSHPGTKKAAAAMAVGVGSFQDPEYLQGLSHYLEHMLFMGSAKYPDENDYDDFLSKHGGSNNAYTELEYTNYHFDIQPRHLEGALDRFAQFFLAPLCKQDSMEREVMAVESEFRGVLQSDSCRSLQLSCHTARPGHVYQKFTWGNKKSLWDKPTEEGVDIRAELLKYYKSTYSAERMNLVVLGGNSLDVLQGWVEEKFSAVPGGLGPRPSIAHQALPFCGQMLYVQPSVKEAHALNIQFQLPSLDAEYWKNAEDYISHLIGHEGKGSLLSILKAKGWASDVYAGVDSSGYEHNQLVYMLSTHVTLTEAGLAAAPGAGLAVAGVVFQYIKMLKEAGPQRWVYDELKAIADMRFMFQEEEDACEYCTNLAPNLHRFPPSHLLRSESLFSEYDPELITKLLGLMSPRAEGLRVDVLTASFDGVRGAMEALSPGGAQEGHEPWFDLTFVQMKLPDELLNQWETADAPPELKLPIENPFIPSNFDVRAGPEVTGEKPDRFSAPSLLADEPGLRVWHKMDTAFRVPKASAYFLLSTPASYSSPLASVKAYLAVKLLEEALNEVAYLADSAELSYSTHLDGLTGITIQVYGFSHKLPALTERIFQTLAGLTVEEAAFCRVKETYSRQLRNAHMKPGKAASYARLYSLRGVMWHTDAQLAALDDLGVGDMQGALPLLLEELHVEMLLHGNMDAAEAQALGSNIHRLLGNKQLLDAQRRAERVVMLGKGTGRVFRMPVKNPEETNSAIEIYYQIKEYDVRSGAIVSMLDQLISEPCYDTLRTKEQLGYTVHCGQRLTHGVLGFCVVIISDTHSAAELDARIESFLDSFAAKLKDMSADEFNHNRLALISNKLIKFTTLSDESDYYWDKIANKWYDFDIRVKEAHALEELSQEDVISWYAEHLAPSSRQRSKLSVQVTGKNHAGSAGGEEAAGVEAVPPVLVSSLDEMKKGLALFPALHRSPAA
eukprot:jgi/Tetstr1/462741/TSEL_000701.t1